MGFFSEEAKSVDVLDKKLECVVCGHDQFLSRKAQLNTAVATFLKLDWSDPSATCFICDECGYIHWFMSR